MSRWVEEFSDQNMKTISKIRTNKRGTEDITHNLYS